MTTTNDIATPELRSVTRGPTPLSIAGASYLAVPLALLAMALGAIGIRDAVIAAGWVGGDPWIPAATSWLAAQNAWSWMLPAGIVLAIAGLVVALVAVKPRRKPTAELTAATAVFIDLGDVARLATASAESIAGVLSARSTASHASVVVRCNVTAALTTEQRQLIDDTVSRELAALKASPKVVVRARTATSR